MGPQNQSQVQIQMMLSESVRQGRYANGVDITTYGDETIIDFQLLHPARGHGDTVARIVISNEFLAQLSANLAQLLQQVSKKPATNEAPTNKQIGFKGNTTELKV